MVFLSRRQNVIKINDIYIYIYIYIYIFIKQKNFYTGLRLES